MPMTAPNTTDKLIGVKKHLPFTLLLLLGFLLSAPAARAELGGDEASLQKEEKHLRVGRRTTHKGKFDRHELKQRDVNLRQYMSSHGRIFGLKWDGQGQPELNSLLGAHAEDFRIALQNARKLRQGRAPLVIEEGNLHIELGSYGRNSYGKVWLKDQIPAGVTPDDLD